MERHKKVYTITNYYDWYITIKERFNYETKQKYKIQIPYLIEQYNTYMKGAKCDWQEQLTQYAPFFPCEL